MLSDVSSTCKGHAEHRLPTKHIHRRLSVCRCLLGNGVKTGGLRSQRHRMQTTIARSSQVLRARQPLKGLIKAAAPLPLLHKGLGFRSFSTSRDVAVSASRELGVLERWVGLLARPLAEEGPEACCGGPATGPQPPPLGFRTSPGPPASS